MGCLKLTYDQESEGIENCAVFLGERLEKKLQSEKNCDDYMPFGGVFNSYTSGTENLYKYNGKEEQKETGWLDYGRRMYMPDLGRFFTQDRFAEQFVGLSPYQYVANNPITSKDVNGDFIVSIHYQMTYDVLRKYGYSESAADVSAYYSSYYADRPSDGILFANNVVARMRHITPLSNRGSQWMDNATAGSQDTSLPGESMRHSMEADGENIGARAAKIRGQKFGWSKIFEAASYGTPDQHTKGSKGGKAFGVGMHALQDSKPHAGTKMSGHSIQKDMGSGAEGFQAWQDAVGITESAVMITEMLNGNFSNVSDGTTLDISGMGQKEFSQLIDVLMKSDKNIRVKNDDDEDD